MASNIVKKETPVPTTRPLDPFDAMRSEINRMFDRFGEGWPSFPGVFSAGSFKDTAVVPDLDVRENGNAIVIEAELPGVDEKDVSVTLQNGMLTLKGEKKFEHEEKKDNYYLSERSFGSFQRTLRLPETIDENKVEAKFEKGVLTITAAKRPEAVKSEKRIEIKKS